MRRALVFVATFAGLVFACVDLLHSTDFDTLCTNDAAAPGCQTDSGDAAPKPHPDFCSQSSTQAARLATRVCAWVGACVHPLGESTFGPCVVKARLAYDCAANPNLRPRAETDDLWSCLANAVSTEPTSCADVKACIFPTPARPCEGGSFTACERSGVRIECESSSQEPAAVEPCALSGRTCVARDTSSAFCVGARGTACNGDPLCVSNGASECGGPDGVDRGVDCTQYGSGACVGQGPPACAPNADAGSCSPSTTKLSCDDAGVASGCVENQPIRIDCSKLDLTCGAPDASLARPEEACTGSTPCTGPDKCDGKGRVVSCGFGKEQNADCQALGLGPCAELKHGAACTPR